MNLLFIIFMFLMTGCAHREMMEEPVLTSIHIIDRNGFTETISNQERLQKYADVDFLREQPYEKVIRIYSRDSAGDVHAYLTSYHPNGLIKQYLEIVNNRAYGTYQEWHLNGNLKIETFVIGGEADIAPSAQKTWLFDGCAQVWNESRELIAEIPYVNGELEGVSIYYHANGNIWKRMPYKKNRLEGLSEIFLEDGRVLQTTQYAADKKHGLSQRFWSDGLIAAHELYQQNQLISANYFDHCGTLISEIKDGAGYRAVFGKEAVSELQQFVNGVQEGEVRVLSPKGDLINLYHTKGGQKHGEEILYYQNGKPQLMINWVNGVIQGLSKTWFPDGAPESQREMSRNEKNGVLTAWYKNGSIMLIEHYDHNKLIDGQYFTKGERLPISEVRNGKGVATLYDADGNFLRKIQYANSKPSE